MLKEKLVELLKQMGKKEREQGGVTWYDVADHLIANGIAFERQKGRWEKKGYKWQCTHCKVLMDIDGTPQENLLNFCPNCGADMSTQNKV